MLRTIYTSSQMNTTLAVYLLKQARWLKRLNKKFKIWELGQEIYTPSDTDSKDFENYNYPFGGWTFLRHVLQIEKK